MPSFAFALALFAPASFAQTQNSPYSPALPQLADVARLSPSQAFVWADGVSKIEDLDAYRQIGFNTVVVRLIWKPSQNGEFSAQDLAPYKAFALEASKRGLSVVFALPATPQGFEAQLRPGTASYNALWKHWVAGAMTLMSDVPTLAGWMLPDDPRALPYFSDRDFRDWGRANYANIQVLNAQWGTSFGAWGQLSLADAFAIAENWRRTNGASNDYRLDTVNQALQNPNSPAANRPTLAWHPAALALALYTAEAYTRVVREWATEVRAIDPNRQRLIFSGVLPDYAQLLALPDEVDVAQPFASPGVLENDVATHNLHSIDLARRGGRFAVVPRFETRASNEVPKEALPSLLDRWIGVAAARGARGIALSSWDEVRDNLELRGALVKTLQKSAASPARELWNRPPVTTLAVLLSPHADGATVRWPAAVPTERGIYGFGHRLVEGEPSNLIWSLRWGTSFGGVDYLTPEDVVSGEVALSKYTTILAPSVLSMPLEAATPLANWVFDGGIFVADLGLGAAQSGFSAGLMSPPLARLFGVAGAWELRRANFNLRGTEPHPRLPRWSQKIGMRPNLSLTTGNAGGNAAFEGAVGYALGSSVAVGVAQGPPIPTNVPGIGAISLRSALTVNDAGRGAAIFAPFRLWANWQPGHFGWNEFHGDLLGRAPTLGVGAEQLVPSPIATEIGTVAFPEVVNRGNSITFLGHEAPGFAPRLAAVQTSGVGDWLWSGGIMQQLSDPTNNFAEGRPAPLPNAAKDQARSRLVALYAAVPPGEVVTMKMEPIAVSSRVNAPLCAKVVKIGEREVELNVWPNVAVVEPQTIEWQPRIGPPSVFTVTLPSAPDGYQAAPGSKHRAIMTDYTAQPDRRGRYPAETKVATADANGQLSWEFSGAACEIKISPVTKS